MSLCESRNDNVGIYTVTQKGQILKLQLCMDTTAQTANEVSKHNV